MAVAVFAIAAALAVFAIITLSVGDLFP
jgi:hypothetical protein